MYWNNNYSLTDLKLKLLLVIVPYFLLRKLYKLKFLKALFLKQCLTKGRDHHLI